LCAASWVPFLLAWAVEAQAQEWRPKDSRIASADVDRSIRKGLGWLKAQPVTDIFPGNRLDDTNELVLYTLLHGGIPPSDPVIAERLRQVVHREPDRVYNVALGAMSLARLDRVGYQWKIAHQAQFLVDNQCENGQWAYGSPVEWDSRTTGEWVLPNSGLYGTKIPPGYHAVPGKAAVGARKLAIRQRSRVTKTGDNSNAQYAALGLRACTEADVHIDPRCLADGLHWWESDQNRDGSWGYSRGEDDAGRATMTAGGIGSMVIFRWMLHKSWTEEPRVRKGMQWLDATVRGRLPKWHIYYLYGVERAGMLYGTDLIGSRDWYDEGAEWLIAHQAENGSWKTVSDTCFAILFLKRATAPLPGVATGGRTSDR
jgi:hypothetical protein